MRQLVHLVTEVMQVAQGVVQMVQMPDRVI